MLLPDLSPARFHEMDSDWLRSLSLQDVKCLVVCRGPVRMEAFEIFEEIGIREYGMLLSEKDSIVYPRCLAPEIRSIRFPANIQLWQISVANAATSPPLSPSKGIELKD